MVRFADEIDFFKSVSNQLLELVKESVGTNKVSKHKEAEGDFATDVDLAVEKAIVAEIQKLFPNDQILAEEEYSDTAIDEGRIWIIDPICGTMNLSRGVNYYCTNIALAEQGEVVASCVIDYNEGTFYWSVGEGLHKESSPHTPQIHTSSTVIDIDAGCLFKASMGTRQKHLKMQWHILESTNYMLVSNSSSLSLLYVALGKFSGYVCINSNAWDMCASAFLVSQVGGFVSAYGGSDWSSKCGSIIATTDSDIHQKLVSASSQSLIIEHWPI